MTSTIQIELPTISLSATEHDEALNVFIGKKSDYYQKKWAAAKQKGKAITWNWAAFFGGLFWMAYRKMYLYALIYLAMIVIWLFCEYQFEWLSSFGKYLLTSVAVCVGWLGNGLYQLHVEKKVKKITEMIKSEQVNDELKRQGGTSIGSVIGIFVLIMALCLL